MKSRSRCYAAVGLRAEYRMNKEWRLLGRIYNCNSLADWIS